jgi:hypothetical protein
METWRLATLNLNLLRGSRDRLRASMEPVNADIWVLTETCRDFQPPGQCELAVASDDAPDLNASKQQVWVAIWSRFPVSGVCMTRDRTRTAAVRLAADPHRQIIIHGIVLPWRADPQRKPLTGANAFCAALHEQSSDWESWRHSFPDQPFCVAGDFNQELAGSDRAGSRVGRELLEAKLTAAGLACLTAGANDPVFNATGEAGIDHLCIGPGLQLASEVKAVPCGIEGHTLVYADLRFGS